MYFDTHAHYDDRRFDTDREELLSMMPSKGVTLILNPGCDRDSSESAIGLAERHEHVYAAVGWHPHEAKTMGDDDEVFLQTRAKHPKVVAIGEIGLDYHYDHSPRDVQREVFARQLEVALGLSFPVIIHDREAHADCLDIIRAHPGVRGVFHCYSGSAEMAKTILDLGFLISFTGVVTYKNARRTLEVAQAIPMDKIMLETDAPYMAPVPYRGKRCDSSHLPYSAEAIANVKGVTVEDVAVKAAENGRVLFGLT